MAVSPYGIRTFYKTNGGEGTFTVPPGAYQIKVECWGAGGSGGGRQSLGAGGGGGGGAYAMSLISVAPGQTFSMTLPRSGTSLSVDGVDGGTTSFGGLVVAVGGKGGFSNGGGGQGGQASECTGEVRFSGGNGANGSGDGDNSYSGGGGGGAGSTGNGQDANTWQGGDYTLWLGGTGGRGLYPDASWSSGRGTWNGGGGSGGRYVTANNPGKEGAEGVVRVTIPYIHQFGQGTKEDPWQIWTVEDLQGIRAYVCSSYGPEFLNVYFKQMADIDLQGVDFHPIGWVWIDVFSNIGAEPRFDDFPFKGNFDGNGFKIMNWNFNVNDFAGYTSQQMSHFNTGFFGYLWGQSNDDDYAPRLERQLIQNITLENANVTVQGQQSAILAGYVAGGGVIANCHVSGNLHGFFRIGGLIGLMTASNAEPPTWSLTTTLEDCTFTGYVEGQDDVGGIVGQVNGGLVQRCGADANVHMIEYVSSTGTHYNISCGVAFVAEGIVKECYGRGKITHEENISLGYIGGFCGYAWGRIENCFGRAEIITNGAEYVGGFIGSWDGNEGDLFNCYSASILNLTGGNLSNAFVGGMYKPQSLPSCYYDSNLTTLTDDYAEGRTTAEMTVPEDFTTTYVNWPFGISWKSDSEFINAGYPIFTKALLVLVNSKPVEFSDAQPSLSGDIYLIPMSAVVKKMGGIVHWDPETYIATAMLEGTIVEFFVNTNQVMVNGQPYTLEYIIPLEEDRTILHAEDINRFFERWRLKIESGTVHYYTGGIFVKKSNWINIPIKNYEYPDLEEEEI